MKKMIAFDFERGEFKLKNGAPVVLTGVEALKQWVQKCLRTQLGRYAIYDGTEYGANIEDLVIGNSYGFDFVESELRREIETALLRNEDIYSMSDFAITKRGSEMNVAFTLHTAYGEMTEEYEYDT